MTTNSNISRELARIHGYDRSKELEEFDSTKLGVKGLVDSGITRIPRIFHHPPETLFDSKSAVADDDQDIIPVIDMSAMHEDVVERIRNAAAKFGFFQVINHGVPVSLLDSLLDVVKAFHELPPEDKMRLYRRDVDATGTGVSFFSNFDLFHSKAASWRDTLSVRLGPVPVVPSHLPDVCRDEVIKGGQEVEHLIDRIMGILSEGLGLTADRLKGMPYVGRGTMVCQYYPYCPEPNKTVGISSHTDPGILTVLLQDQVGGLQVKCDEKWVNMRPVHGALVINIGDLFQIISNDAYKSGEHRVFANPFRTPRLSIACFFSPGFDDKLYGPLPELNSTEKPALYQQLKFSELLRLFFSTELKGRSMANYYKL